MRLLRIELTRLRWRRAVLMLAALSIVIPILIWAGMAWGTRPVSDADLADAERQVQLERENMKGLVEECTTTPENFGLPPEIENAEEACAQQFGEPDISWYLHRDQLDAGNAKEHGLGVATVLLGLALLIGATFAGADWSSGSMSNQLLFEPRRMRVWTAKAGAILLGTAVIAAVALAAFWAATWGTMESRDIATSAAQWRDIAGEASRSVAFTAGAGLAGFVVTMLLRSTVGTLGVMLAFSIGGSLVVAALPIDGSGRWMLPNNVFGILQNGYQYYDSTAPGCMNGSGGALACEPTLSLAEGLRFFSVILVVGVALSLASFRRRDVP